VFTTFIIISASIALLSTPALYMVLGKTRFLSKVKKHDSHHPISIIIPARNEEQNIATLLKSLNKQNLPPHQIIVVDDDSTDNTAQIAKQYEAHVLTAKSLPDDWMGKPWACQQGAETATGEWLLFLDADTHLNPNSLEYLQGAIHETNSSAVISVKPYHSIQKTYEELSSFFNLLMTAGVSAFGTTQKSDTALFGQCMLISKNHYQQVGGHAKVKKDILENLYLAEHLEKLNIPRACYLGKNSISMRMFPHGFTSLWNGWKKGFSSGAKQVAPITLILSSIWISGAMFAAITLIISLLTAFSKISLILTLFTYSIYALQCHLTFKKIGSFSPLNALFYPITLFFYQALFFTSLLNRKHGGTTQWKGRSVN